MQILNALRSRNITVGGLCADSRKVAPGDVFVALPGANADGRHFIAQAVARGASAVLHDAGGGSVGECEVPVLAVPDLPSLSGEIAHLVYGCPSEKLWLAGITGTNGKTSVSQWLARSLDLLGRKCAVIGTLGNGFPGALQESPNTTPDAIAVHRLLAGFVAQDAGACAMEVSSIGLDQGRVNAACFAVAAFTNLTRDHLDYHPDMAAYAAAKAKLFEHPGLGCAVLNLDDEFGRTLAGRLRGRVPTIGYTLEGAGGTDRVLAAGQLEIGGAGISFMLDGLRVEAPLLGRFNAANLLAVIGLLQAGGYALPRIIPVLARLHPPPGRLQTLGGGKSPLLVIDYTHSPDALEKALVVLRETAQARRGKLVCVFGCGGNRDAGKRPLMGAVAERLADSVVVTSDNPRSEDPAAIIAAICAGMRAAPSIEPDRTQAIVRAVHAAGACDVILIAGKGHEAYQEIASVRHAYSDLEVATRALETWQ